MFNQPSFKYALLVADVASLVAAILAALALSVPGELVSSRSSPIDIAAVVIVIAVSLPIFLFMFFVNNLYKRQTLASRYRHITIILRSLIISIVILLPLVFVFWWDFFASYGRQFVSYFLVFALLGTSISRLAIVRVFVNPLHSSRKQRLLIVGSDSAALKVVEAIKRDRRSAFQIIGFVDDYKDSGEPLFDEWKNLGKLEDLNTVVERLAPDEILIAVDKAHYSRLVDIVNSCLATGRVVRVFSDRLAVLAERLGAEQYAEGIPVIMLSQVQPSALSKSVRRIVDIILALATLTLLSPLLIAVGIGIKLSSPGPVIFRQTRIGYAGQPFDFYKFRSMHVGETVGQHQAYVEKFIKGDAGDNVSSNEIHVFKMQDDPRIFPFGRFIRRTSLDEFPQLFNVLKGDMGLVGPRPCLPYEWDAYNEWHKGRLKVLPGCTGLWQVLGRSTVTFEDMVIMDLYYISNYSLFQDARILYKTIPTIFFAKGGF